MPPNAAPDSDSCCEAKTDPISEFRERLDKVG